MLTTPKIQTNMIQDPIQVSQPKAAAQHAGETGIGCLRMVLPSFGLLLEELWETPFAVPDVASIDESSQVEPRPDETDRGQSSE